MRLLSDNYAKEDVLGFGDRADFLAELIKTADDLPFAVGVYGEWGSGKTTLMRMVEARVQGTYPTVWFNAWKYDGKEVVWNALIQEIFASMLRRDPAAGAAGSEAFHQRVGTVARGLAKYAAKVATRLVPGGVIREEDVDELARIFSPSAVDGSFEFINRFEETFRDLVTDLVGTDGVLVVFVDDLDRCLPENAITVFEALKLYLDEARCVFVVGVEPHVVTEAIRARYKDNPRLSATSYLDKIIQFPVFVPKPRRIAVQRMLASGPDSLDRQDARLRTLIVQGAVRNPRLIKRLLNTYGMIAGQWPKPLSNDEQAALIKVLLLQARFPDVYRALSTRSSLLDKMDAARRDGTAADAETQAFLRDPELVRFLDKFAHVKVSGKQVRRWTRVAGAVTDEEDTEED